MSPDGNNFYCCDYSRDAGEQLFATASRADVWLMLEYTGVWGTKAFEESTLSQAVKDHLSASLKAMPNARLQIIRRQKAGDDIAFYIAVTRELNPTLYRFRLSSYDDLLALDIADVIANGAAYQDHLSQEPMFFVCVNSKRDRSCAKYGLPVYQTLARDVGDAVWQSNHVGGHRFAATGVCFPHGVVYGRMDTQAAGRIFDAYRQGRLVMEYYRGRSCYEPVVQAADYFLREQTGVRDLAGFRLMGVESVSENVSAVRFESLGDVRTHQINVLTEMSDFGIYSNSTDTEKAPVPQFRLVEYRALELPR